MHKLMIKFLTIYLNAYEHCEVLCIKLNKIYIYIVCCLLSVNINVIIYALNVLRFKYVMKDLTYRECRWLETFSSEPSDYSLLKAWRPNHLCHQRKMYMVMFETMPKSRESTSILLKEKGLGICYSTPFPLCMLEIFYIPCTE